jgi:competence protein ComEA
VLSSTDDSSSVDEQAPSGLIDLTEPARTLVVHVVGQVQNPGLVELPDGSRVADAITAAGGATDQADLAALNLARLLGDGEQILVPIPGETVPQAGAASSGLLDLNTADESALEELPGIGPVLAGRIVAWRQQHGRFSSVDELVEVAGIGPAILAQIRDLVRV